MTTISPWVWQYATSPSPQSKNISIGIDRGSPVCTLALMKAIAPGVYESDSGFFVRVTVKGSRTWRKLAAVKKKEAIREGQALFSQISQARHGLAKDPFAAPACSVAGLVQQYLDSGCPDKRMHPRPEQFCKQEAARLSRVVEYFGKWAADEVRIKDLHGYCSWRTRNATKGSGHRAVDLELNSLSNACNYGVNTGCLDINFLSRGRPRFQKSSDVRHCREFIPESGEELNRLAAALFANPASEALGWQLLFEAMTGCRTNEILRLRTDAVRGSPGFIESGRLDIRRSKSGVSPWVVIHPDLAELIQAWRAWHGGRSVWWLPGRDPGQPLDKTSLAHALARITKELGLPRRTSHGLRAFFVTLQRRAGYRDEEVAEMIGDKTVSLIQSTYGERRFGEAKLSWRSENPAWSRWLPEPELLSPNFKAA